MKKILSVLLVLIFCCTIFVACTPLHYMDSAAAKADNYTIVASYDTETKILSAVQTVEVTNNSANTFESIKFHIYANAYREDAARAIVPSSYTNQAYVNGKSYGDIAFDSVKVADQAVAFVIEGEDNDILSVPVPTFFPGEKVVISMTYEIQLANIHHRLGYGQNTVNLGNFYPVLCHISDQAYSATPYYAVGDPFVTELANFDVTLTVPSTYLVASSGNLIEATNDDTQSTTTYKYQGLALRDFAMVLSDKFQKMTQQVGDVMLYYYYFDDKTPEATLATMVGTMQFMNQNVAEYPYQQMTVVETDFCYGGMEYATLAMVSSGSPSYVEGVAHEIIHQWFYGVVGSNQIENAWMDEGLTEYLTMLFLDESKYTELGTAIKQNVKLYTSYVDVLKNYFGDLDTSFRPIYSYKNDQEYVYITYIKGSLMFNDMYNIMGRTKFFKALQNYYTACRAKIATPNDLISAFTKASGADMTKLFNTYIEGKELLFEQ